MDADVAKVSHRLSWAGLAVLFLWYAGPLSAQETLERYNVWDLHRGMSISEIPEDAFINYACGTNGGPPSLPLNGLRDYARCLPEPRCMADGGSLHEVYVEYDDQIEYWARAHDFQLLVARFSGTKVLTHPVILSLVFSDPGILRGIRIVTDPRAGLEARTAAYMLAPQMKGRYGLEAWQCTDLPRAEGETPMADIYVKEQCTKLHEEGRLFIEAHFYKQRGQQTIDPHTRRVRVGEFESRARLEIWHPLVQSDCD